MPVDTFIIINADDFGWTEGINEGIITAHRHGVLTSATLLANARATRHAIDLLRLWPNLSVGVHLSYHLGEPLLPRHELDALFDPDGRPKFSIPKLWAAVTLWKKVRHQLDAHFRSQVEQLLRFGLSLTHLDTHKHLHFWPAVFELVAKIAADYKIPAVRLIREDPTDRGPSVAKLRLGLAAMYWTSYVNQYKVAKYNLRCPDRLAGIIQTGQWTKQTFMDIVRSARPGVMEIMTHPGYPEGLDKEPTRLVQSREAELEILTYPLVKEYFHQWPATTKLIGYRDLPGLR